MDDEVAVAATTGVAQVFDLHALKAFGGAMSAPEACRIPESIFT